LQLNELMRGRAIFVLLGLTAFGAYSLGRQTAPVSNAPVPAITPLAQPVAFMGPAAQAPAPAPAPSVFSGPTPSTKAGLPDKPAAPDTKRNVEAGLTAAAVAAIIVQTSRGLRCVLDRIEDSDKGPLKSSG
jgi:hypothetical protein